MIFFRQVFSVLRLFFARERANLQPLAFNGVILPVVLSYLGSRLAISPAQFRLWLGGCVTLALGLNAVNQIGFYVLCDRFQHGLALLNTTLVTKPVYYVALLIMAIIESALLISTSMALFALIGISLHFSSLALGAVAAVCGSAMLSGIGILVALKVPDFDTGSSTIGGLALGLALVSPLFYSVNSLPTAFRVLVFLSPFTFVAPLVRAVVDGGSAPAWAIAGSIAIAIGLNAVCFRAVPWNVD